MSSSPPEKPAGQEPAGQGPARQEPAGGLFAKFGACWLPRVEAALEELLPPADRRPKALHQAMRHALFPGGKRLRPLLALLGCQATGGEMERALVPAAGMELLHGYSLVHDDLPCMDDDELRRGRPTCHVLHGEALAVLAGDALQALAFMAVVQGGEQAVLVLSLAAGSLGMVGGQAEDMAATAQAQTPPGQAEPGQAEPGQAEPGQAEPGQAELGQLQWIHDHKTGALIRASLLVGAHAGGGSTARLEALDRYGILIGRAFQITDDCLDLTAPAESLGRAPGRDLARQKLTYPAVMGLSASQRLASDLAKQASEMAEEICSSSGDSTRLYESRALLQDVALFTVARGS